MLPVRQPLLLWLVVTALRARSRIRINFRRWWSIRTFHLNRPAKFAGIEIAAKPARSAGRESPSSIDPTTRRGGGDADREPEPISRTGSSISVVKGETLATSNPGSLVDALRTVPGLDISEAADRVRPRISGCAAPNRPELVMIDGIRINDPTAASGDFDFAMFAPSAIERIEVLKGPQSALYGSDAMGGVVNIITKKGSGPAQFNVRTEGGSYGTGSPRDRCGIHRGRGRMRSQAAGSTATASPATVIVSRRWRPDSVRWSATVSTVSAVRPARHDAGEGVRLETGMLSSFTRSAYDQSPARFPTHRRARQGSCSRSGDAPRSIRSGDPHPQPQRIRYPHRSFLQRCDLRINKLPQNTTSTISDFIGNSTGAEYRAI